MKLRLLGCVIASLIAATLCTIFAEDLHILLEGEPGASSYSDTEAVATDDGGDRRLPWFIMHVGPPKTGSTTMQFFLKLSSSVKTLEDDGYATIAKRPNVVSWRKANGQRVVPLPAYSLERIQSAVDKGQNLLFSHEGLANAAASALRGLLDVIDTKFNIRVVQTYRRLHEYLPSVYNQKRRKCEGVVLGCSKWPSVDVGTERQHQAIPTFLEHFQRSFARSDDESHAYVFTRPDRVRDVLDKYAVLKSTAKSAVSFRVFNMHEEGDMVSNFFCQMIPNASHMCQLVKDQALVANSSSYHRNKAVVLDYDRLAVYAQEMGILNGSYYINRTDVATRIQHYQEEIRELTDKDLPQDCPSPEQMDAIYQASLRMEEFAFPLIYPNTYREWKNKGLRPEHLQDFNRSWQKTLDGSNLCNVDCQATLELPEWKDFFAREFPWPQL